MVMLKRNRAILAGLVLAVLSLSAQPTLMGTGYWKMSCSYFACAYAKAPHYMAPELWNVPAGYKQVGTKLADAKPGDIAAFHGVHVAVLSPEGIWLDSDYRHNGVGRMQASANDPWFRGEIKIIRWVGNQK